MILPAQGMSRLPAHLAFVVQFSAGSDVTQEQFSGRVEHVTSGQATEFFTLEEAVAFMREVLFTRRDT